MRYLLFSLFLSFGASAQLSAEFVAGLPFVEFTAESSNILTCYVRDGPTFFAEVGTDVDSSSSLQAKISRCIPIVQSYLDDQANAWKSGYNYTQQNWVYSWSATYVAVTKTLWANGHKEKSWYVHYTSLVSSETTRCKDPDFPYEWDDAATSSPIDKCLRPSDISFKQSVDSSCPMDSLIPAIGSGLTNNLDGAACVASSSGDGSLCYMENNGTSFMAAEGDCYVTDILEPQEYPNLSITPPDGTCSTMGSGGLVCVADPAEHCDAQGVCTPNCGYVDNSFYCFPQDANNDGIPDNDVDGDGLVDVDKNQNGTPDFNETCSAGICLNNATGEETTTGVGSSTSSTGETTESKIDFSPLIDANTMPEFDSTTKVKMDALSKEYFKTYEDVLGKDYKTSGGVVVDESTYSVGDKIKSLVPTSGACVNPTFTFAGRSETLDLCLLASKVNPLLSWIFGFMTVVYLYRQINAAIKLTGT